MNSLNINGYEVPLIPSGLRHEETIIQTANALEYLNNTINDIFNKIDNRVNKNNEKMKEIKTRIDKANDKIKSLIGTKKAICIYSPAKFPAVHILKNIPATFSEESYKNVNFKLKTDYEIESDFEPLTQTSLQDKLEFFHVKETLEPSRISKIVNNSKGLGEIPIGLKSVNSLLLYNTTQNVYARGKEKGVFKSQVHVQLNEDKTENLKKKIEAPPTSITTRQLGSEKKFHQKLFYTPKLNDAPDINLPLDLPDLPGVADIHFEVERKVKIAPSVYVNNQNSEVVDSQKTETKENINIEKSIVPNNISEQKELSIKVINNSTISPPPPPIPPPPPPPLPPVPESSTSSTELDSKRSLSKTPDISDVRSNLMEAIRKAGGTRGGKLRAASDIISDKTACNNNNSSNNLMDDLHKKLLMRRKGISGSKDADRSENVLDKISSLIPPPPKPYQGMYSSPSDNDNDNEDWD